MAGITEKSFEILFPLRSLKKHGAVYWFRTTGNIWKAHKNRGWSKW